LNALLERARCYHELVATKPGWKLVAHGRIGAASELLALLAAQVAALLASESPELVKRCAGADCVLLLWFVDRTKAHRRVFCSASACGNRARVAAFRHRQRKNNP
jgi:predicted RNA-binding Zn ribbon-like protein